MKQKRNLSRRDREYLPKNPTANVINGEQSNTSHYDEVQGKGFSHLFNIVLEVPSNAQDKKKKSKAFLFMGKEDIKLSLSIGDMTSYVENSKESTKIAWNP